MIWPDWTGQDAAVVASGPSTRQADVALLNGRVRVLAIKKNVEIAPFADVVYGCDYPWWRSVRGLPDFPGLKLAYDDKAVKEFCLGKVEIVRHLSKAGTYPGGYQAACDRIMNETLGVVGNGGNSGFQALNLAVQFGARRILLIGIDCQDRSGVHWYGRNGWHAANNPGEHNFKRWRAAFDAAAQQLRELGVEVVNASPISQIKSFRQAGVAETLAQWGH